HLQDHHPRWAKVHLNTSVHLQQWSRRAAADARNRAAMHHYAFKDRPADPRLELQESIDGRDFYVALAAAAHADKGEHGAVYGGQRVPGPVGAPGVDLLGLPLHH